MLMKLMKCFGLNSILLYICCSNRLENSGFFFHFKIALKIFITNPVNRKKKHTQIYKNNPHIHVIVTCMAKYEDSYKSGHTQMQLFELQNVCVLKAVQRTKEN